MAKEIARRLRNTIGHAASVTHTGSPRLGQMIKRATALAFLVVGLTTSSARADEICGHAFANSIQQLYSKIATIPRAQVVLNDDRFIAIADMDAKVVWTFTKASHPAAPAVVCRRAVEVNGRVEVDLQSRCGGSKEACDAMIADFKALPKH